MRATLIAVLAAAALAPAAAADAPGDALPGRMLPFPPLGSPFAPPLPATGQRPPLGPMPAPAPAPTLARVVARPMPAHGLLRGFSDGSALAQPALVAATIARAGRAGASVVRVPMSWRTIEGARTPTDPTDPDDPAYNFGHWDALLEQIVAAGRQPLVTVYNAPDAHKAPLRWRFVWCAAAAGGPTVRCYRASTPSRPA